MTATERYVKDMLLYDLIAPEAPKPSPHYRGTGPCAGIVVDKVDALDYALDTVQTDESMRKQFLEWFYFDWKEEE